MSDLVPNTAEREHSPAALPGDAPAPPSVQIRGMKTVFSDWTALMGGRLAGVLLGLVSVVLTTRILSPSGYGALGFASVAAGLLYTVTAAWNGTAVSRYGREELEHRGGMAAVTWNRALMIAPLIALGASLLVVMKFAGGVPRNVTWPLLGLAVISGLVAIVADHVTVLLEATGRMKWSAAASVLPKALLLGAFAGILVTGAGKTPAMILIVSIAAAALVTVAFAASIWHVALWPPTWDRALMRRMLGLSIPLIMFTISTYVVSSIDIFVLGLYRPPSDVGLYAVAYRGYTVLQALAAAAPPLIVPLFVSVKLAGREALLDYYVDRTVSQLTFIAAVAAGLAIPLVRTFAPIVFGTRFTEAGTPLAILLVAWLPYLVATLVAPVLVLAERTRAVGLVSLLSAALNVAGDFFLVGVLGMGTTGTAIATVASLVVLAAGFLFVVRQCAGSHGGVHPFAAFPLLASVVPFFAIGGVAGTATGFAAAIGATLVVLYGTRLFDASDIDMIHRLDMPAWLSRIAVRALVHFAR